METTVENDHKRSEEEDDILNRSKKRYREEDDASEVDVATQENQKEKFSFRDTLVDHPNHPVELDSEDWVSDDDDDGMEKPEEEDPLCPRIKISKEEKNIIRKPWKRTLIIKLLRRSIGYKTLWSRIIAMRRPKAAIDLVAMDNDYFLAKFSSDDDYVFTKYGGPWLIFNHYLTVRSWTPNFDTAQDNLKNLLVWVCIPYLPIEYCDKAFLMRVGAKIGRPIKIDEATSLVSRGQFA